MAKTKTRTKMTTTRKPAEPPVSSSVLDASLEDVLRYVETLVTERNSYKLSELFARLSVEVIYDPAILRAMIAVAWSSGAGEEIAFLCRSIRDADD